MTSFYQNMHPDPLVRKFLYELGSDFMGAEMVETVEIHDVHRLLKYAATGLERHWKGEALPAPSLPPDFE